MTDEDMPQPGPSEPEIGFGDLGGWSLEHSFSPWAPDGSLVFGQTDGAGDGYILQSTDFTCAVVCQQMLLRDFGVELSESDLVFEATSQGWLTREGTSPEDVGRLLESHGVQTHVIHGASVRQIADELAHGHKVIATLDSGELWGADSPFEDWLNPQGADHAIVITGMDLSDPEHPFICVNDPGDPNGGGRKYPLDEFLRAWDDSGHMCIATDESPANLSQHMHYGANFDADAGIYMDITFWETLVTAIVHAIDPSFVPGASEPVATTAPRQQSLETLDDDQRNDLFLQL